MERRNIIAIGILLVMILTAIAVLSIIEKPAEAAETSSNRFDSNPSLWYGQYDNVAVVTENAQCSEIGNNTLSNGGSAADAAISIALCIGIVNNCDSGIGGGLFLTYSNDETGEYYRLNGRETAPLQSTEDMFANDPEAAVNGGKSIATPGAIKAYHTLHQRYGKLPWADLFQANIKLARDGYIVTEFLASKIENKQSFIRDSTNNMGIYLNEDGSLKLKGQTVQNPEFADTLEIIASDPDSFYTGQLAKDIISDIADHDGILSLEDLAQYTVIEETSDDFELVNLPNRGIDLVVPPAVSGGNLVAYILGVIDTYFTEKGMDYPDVLTYHRLIEIWKFAFGQRSNLGDPEFVDGAQELLDELIKPETWLDVRSKINDHRTDVTYEYYGGAFAPESHGTSHFAVMTQHETIAFTQSVNLEFGAKFRGKRTAIIFNDHMDDFSVPGKINEFGIPPSEANYIVPGKRPQSSMSPTIVKKDGKNFMAVGGTGGSKIITAASLMVFDRLNLGMALDQAVATERIHHQLAPMTVSFQKGFSQDILDGLIGKGHNVTEYDYNSSSASTIYRDDDGVVYSKGDNRKPGCGPAGF